MIGEELKQAVREANEHLQSIINRVCGACDYSCCHQGTMVGSHGVTRLLKGMRLHEDLDEQVREGLKVRAKELRADLATIDRVVSMLRSAYPEQDEDDYKQLNRCIDQWRDFIEFMESDFPLTAKSLTRLTQFSAVRHNLLREFRKFPGSESALANFSVEGGTFRFRGRKLAPPRCIFHLDGCLLGQYRPVKCADFFCTADPNLLEECQKEMDFDEFVMANMYVEDFEAVREAIALENELGSQYWEPKIILTDDQEQIDRAISLLNLREGDVDVRKEAGNFFLSTEEAIEVIRQQGRANTTVFVTDGVTGPALYELAVALGRTRSETALGGFALIARDFPTPSVMPHPMWSDRMMSQPLGSLEIYVL